MNRATRFPVDIAGAADDGALLLPDSELQDRSDLFRQLCARGRLTDFSRVRDEVWEDRFDPTGTGIHHPARADSAAIKPASAAIEIK